MNKKDKDKLFESVKEAMTIKYIMYLMDKLYKEEKITKWEHKLLIRGCKEKLEDCCKREVYCEGKKNSGNLYSCIN